ncbi:MAG: Cell division protein FtsL [Candidatus Anoxychlamydiales bacterium]|nr:Cell division protein FtsL [Candidatus Anoxychlamydiales bacterium]
MNKSIIFRIICCLIVFGLCLYFYIEKQNELTEMKIKIPKLAKEISDLKEEIRKAKYEIKQFESPNRLMELVKSQEFSHLKHPFVNQVLSIKEGIALKEDMKKDILIP